MSDPRRDRAGGPAHVETPMLSRRAHFRRIERQPVARNSRRDGAAHRAGRVDRQDPEDFLGRVQLGDGVPLNDRSLRFLENPASSDLLSYATANRDTVDTGSKAASNNGIQVMAKLVEASIADPIA
jgi:hypothetical protein